MPKNMENSMERGRFRRYVGLIGFPKLPYRDSIVALALSDLGFESLVVQGLDRDRFLESRSSSGTGSSSVFGV